MKHLSFFPITLLVFTVTSILLCIELPSDPAENPKNSDIILFIDNNIVYQGDTPAIGLHFLLSHHFESASITTSCNVFDTAFTTDSLDEFDTVYCKPTFSTTGPCTVFVNAHFRDSGLKDKCDTIPLYILPREAGISFTTVAPSMSIVVGKTDTLLFVTRSTGSVTQTPDYSITAEPPTGISITPFYSSLKDTVHVIITPTVADTYTIKAKASVIYNNSWLVDSAFSGVRVSAAGILLPSYIDIPKAISIGTIDTLIFAVNNSNNSDKLSIKLATKSHLDTTVFSVLPTGSDSILIKVKPTHAGSAEIGIIISNKSRSDTTWYPVSLGISTATLWNKTEIAVTATEGKPIKQSLQSYFVKPDSGSVVFTTDSGIIKDTTWEWTPSYGCNVTSVANITATRGNTLSTKLKLIITVTPGDTTKPILSLVDQTLDGKKINSSQITVKCSAKDSEAGVGSVSITSGTTTIDAVLLSDSVYSGIVSGLQNGKPTEIIITATDKSIKKNNRVIKFTVTYDTTIPVVAPAITTPLQATLQVIEGTPLALKIVATGTPEPTYQWFKDDKQVAGQTTAEFSKNNVTASDSGTYYVVVSNGIGNNVTSTKALVTIRLRATITQEPVATTVNEGGSGSFSVKAVGEGPLSYKWFEDGSAISGATSATYTISDAANTDNNKKFSCVVSNTINQDTSLAATLTVTAKPIYKVSFNVGDESIPPVEQQVAEGGKATLPQSLVRNGYDFMGWYKDAATTYGWNFTTDIVNGPVTLYAKWVIKNYIITYNLNNGTNGNNPANYTITTPLITLANASRSGYDFAGWFDNATLTGTPVTSIITGSTGDKAFWAKWTEKNFSITYNLNSGINGSNPTSYTITSTAITLSNASRDGYDFGGWFDNSTFTGSAVTTIPSGSTGDKALWAKWTEKQFSITYNLNSGTNGSNPTSFTVSTPAITLANASRNGYDFGGWFDNSTLTGTAVSNIPMGSAGNKAFWAKWVEKTYSITYNLNSGTNGSNPTSYTVTSTTITLASASRNGYDFGGWFDNSTLTGTAVSSIPTGSTGNKAFWVKWVEKNYSITYNLNGGTNGSNPASYTIASQTITLANASKSGYVFIGWYDNAGLSGTAVTTIPSGSTENKTFWAKWKKVCIITFDGQSATTPANPATATIDSASAIGSLPTDPVRTSYFFDGWYTGTNGTGSRVTTSMAFSTNATVYAKWIIKDADNNIYTEVKIGNQVWMVENLKVTTYNDGTAIPNVTDSLEWSNLGTGAYCFYNNYTGNKSIYGGLYNWHAVNTGKLAPKGWHVPTTVEMETLLNYLIANGYNYDGTTSENKVAKSIASDHSAYWEASTTEGAPGNQTTLNNKSGYTGEPGGYRVVEWYQKGVFQAEGILGYWWSSTQATGYSGTHANTLRLDTNDPGISIYWDFVKENGLSVRCIRD